MKLRRADCGHWMVATDNPTGETKHGDPVFLCRECTAKVLQSPKLKLTKK